ncbi:MAG: hydrogenase maturation protease [Candidatus Zixiibacteriota bacterium]
MTTKNPILVIGVGNDFHSDDGVGLYVAREIRKKGLKNTTIIEGINDGTSMIEAWKGISRAIVIDCVHSKGKSGIIYRFDALKENIPESYFPSLSTHAFNITDTIALARSIDYLPNSLIIYGIRGQKFGTGQGLTAMVQKGADEMIIRIVEEIELVLAGDLK